MGIVRKSITIVRTCPTCKKSFVAKTYWQKHCSFQCRRKPLIGEWITCATCGKRFYKPPCRINKYHKEKGGKTYKTRFCSRKCSHISMRTDSGKDVKCSVCGKIYYTNNKRRKVTCSPECSANRMSHTITTAALDNRWAHAVKLNAGSKCEYCGDTENLNSHHVYSRSNYNTRWDEENGVCLCAYHHVYGNQSFHKSPLEMLDWLKSKRGKEWHDRLRVKAKQQHPGIRELKSLAFNKLPAVKPSTVPAYGKKEEL